MSTCDIWLTVWVGMTQLGGHSIYLGPENIGLGQREPIKDVSNVLSRMADIVIARVFKNETVVVYPREFAD